MRKYLPFTILIFTLSLCIVTIGLASNSPISKKSLQFLKNEKIKVKAEKLEELLKTQEFREMIKNKYFHNSNNDTKQSNSLQSLDNKIISSSSSIESEIHAAINPIDSNNIVVSPIRQATSMSTDAISLPIYYTKDFGKTWNTSTFQPKPPVNDYYIMGGGDPVFAFDANGKLYFTWIHLYATLKNYNIDSLFAGLFCAESVDGGATWTYNNRSVAPLGSGLYYSAYQLSSMIDKQWMACDLSNSIYRNRLYVSGIFMDNTNDFQEMKTYIKKAENFNFDTNSVAVDGNIFSTIQFSSIGVDDKGIIHYAFYANDEDKEMIIHTSSNDGGATWSDLHLISNLYGVLINPVQIDGISESRLYPCSYLAVDNNQQSNYKGNLYMTWSSAGINSYDGKGFDVYFCKSTNSGLTWSTPIKVNKDGLDDIHNFYPSITVNPKGVVVISWFDRANYTNAQTDHVLATSNDGGNSFSDMTLITNQPSNFNYIGYNNGLFGIGEYSGLVASNSYAIPFWADGRSNNGNISVYSALVPINQEASVEQYGVINGGFSISNLFPNPAIEKTQLEINIENAGEYQISLFNNKGQNLMEIANEYMPIGTKTIDISTSNLINGIYYVRISNSKDYVIRKLTINK